ncbi:hypothetical protein [Bradyrhizobium sp. USDA 4353]
MAATLDDILSAITGAGHSGVTKGEIDKKFVGKSKERAAEVRKTLDALLHKGAIRGPFKSGRSFYYFAPDYGPTIETASRAIEALIASAGTKLLSKPTLEKKITGMNKKFFPDGLTHAKSSGAIVELSCGSSKYFLHRDVAADHFGFETTTQEPPPRPAQPSNDQSANAAQLTLDTVLPVYRRLKLEQGGFSAVKIYDLIKASGASRDAMHQLLVGEAKAGRVTIHPTTSVELPHEVLDAAIRLPGFSEPFVTVVVKGEP